MRLLSMLLPAALVGLSSAQHAENEYDQMSSEEQQDSSDMISLAVKRVVANRSHFNLGL